MAALRLSVRTPASYDSRSARGWQYPGNTSLMFVLYGYALGNFLIPARWAKQCSAIRIRRKLAVKTFWIFNQIDTLLGD